MICKMKMTTEFQQVWIGCKFVLRIKLRKYTLVKIGDEKFLIDFHPDNNFVKRNVTKVKTLTRDMFRMLNVLGDM